MSAALAAGLDTTLKGMISGVSIATARYRRDFEGMEPILKSAAAHLPASSVERLDGLRKSALLRLGEVDSRIRELEKAGQTAVDAIARIDGLQADADASFTRLAAAVDAITAELAGMKKRLEEADPA